MLSLATLVLATVVAAPAAAAEAYPSRPIRLILPFPAGGPTDILGRALGQKLSEQVGQPVVADNRPGPGGVKTRLAQAGVEPLHSAPEQFASFIGTETTRYAQVIRNAGIKPE